MKTIASLIAGMFLIGVSPLTLGDPDKDESGHGKHKYERRAHKGGDYKEEFWDGNCKVERNWERNGKFKEERKCEGPRHHHRGYDHDRRSEARIPGIYEFLPSR
jgi:hypothetical protein